MRPFSVTAFNTIANTVSDKVDVRFMHVLSVDVAWSAFASIPSPFDVATGTPFSVTTNVITAVAHGLETGQAVVPTISDGSHPSPLVSGTEYFAIRLSADTFALATTRARAVAGTPVVDLTTQGTDSETVTFTPQANAGTVLVEYTTDLEPTLNSIWRTLDTINLASDSSPDIVKTTYVSFHFVRATLNVTKGALSGNCKVVFHGK
jgi:hypothetical protein